MNYEIVWTQDSSPSLRQEECMHHRAGAYGETQYIYGEAIRRALKQPLSSFSVLVVGLGLGYIELIAMGEYLKNPRLSFRMLSYECDPFLRDSFLDWLSEKMIETHPLFQVYERIGQLIKNDYDLFAIRSQLIYRYQRQDWQILPLLSNEHIPNEKFHMILYDAFSGKSTPELWGEDFLKSFLERTSAAPTCFATYACTGALKRALRERNFNIELRSGYSGKRNSTFASLF